MLTGYVDHASVGIVVGNEDARRGVDHLGAQRIGQIVLAPDGVLAVRLARESRREQTARVAQEDDFARLAAHVTQSFLFDAPRARIDDAQLLVLAGGGQQAAVAVERHRVDHVRVAFDDVDRLPRPSTNQTTFNNKVMKK